MDGIRGLYVHKYVICTVPFILPKKYDNMKGTDNTPEKILAKQQSFIVKKKIFNYLKTITVFKGTLPVYLFFYH